MLYGSHTKATRVRFDNYITGLERMEIGLFKIKAYLKDN